MELRRNREGAGALVSDYISELAARIGSHVPARLCPDEPHRDRLFRIYAVLALAKGVDTTSEDVHNAWVAWMAEHDPEHEALRPFSELAVADRAQDDPFVEAIHAVVQIPGSH